MLAPQRPLGSNVSPEPPVPLVEILLQSMGEGCPASTVETEKPMTYVLIGVWPPVGSARSFTISNDLSVYGHTPAIPLLDPSQVGRRSRFGSPSVSRTM